MTEIRQKTMKEAAAEYDEILKSKAVPIRQLSDESYQDIFFHYLGLTRKNPYFPHIDLYVIEPKNQEDIYAINLFCKKHTGYHDQDMSHIIKPNSKYVLCLMPGLPDNTSEGFVVFAVNYERLKEFYIDVMRKIDEISV